MVLLGDFTGHGLPAAIGALPLAEVFHGMVSKRFALEDVLREVNTKLKSILPVGVFCCATAAHLELSQSQHRGLGRRFYLRVSFIMLEPKISKNTLTAFATGYFIINQFKYKPSYFEMDDEDVIYLV